MNVQVFSQIIKVNTYRDILFSIIYILIGLLVVRLISFLLDYLKRKLKDKIITQEIISIIKSKIIPITYFFAFYLGINRLILNDILKKTLNYTGLFLTLFFIVTLIQRLLVFLLRKYYEKTGRDVSKKQIFDVLALLIKVSIWFMAFLIVLDNLGIKISGFLAGLGIGGVAIAFAAQAILEDFFSYFIILFDQPFKVGDFLIVGDFLGTVEDIGIKTTRFTSLSGEQIIFPNRDLINSRIKNYKKLERRRIKFQFGVVYQTPLEKVKKVPGIVKDIIDNTELVDYDRCHFLAFADYSLKFEVVYYVNNPEYVKYMDVNQHIHFRMKEEFEKEDIKFAFPSQSIYMAQTDYLEGQENEEIV